MEKHIQFLIIFGIMSLSSKAQKLNELDVTTLSANAGYSGTSFSSMLMDGNRTWLVPGLAANKPVTPMVAKGIMLVEDGKVTLFNMAKGTLASDSVFRILSINGELLALTAAGIQKFDGSKFVKSTLNNGLSDQIVYDMVRYGSSIYFGTGSGVYQKQGNTVKTVASAGLSIYKLTALGGKIFSSGYQGIVEFDTSIKTEKIIRKPYTPNATELGEFKDYLVAFYRFKGADTFTMSTGFYKNGIWYDLEDITGNCERQTNQGFRGVPKAIAGQGVKVVLRNYGFNSDNGLAFLDGYGIRDYLIAYGLNAPMIFTANSNEVSDIVLTNNKLILRKGDWKSYEDYYRSGFPKSDKLRGNSVDFKVGVANRNEGFDFLNDRMKTRNCAATIFNRALWLGNMGKDNIVRTAVTTYSTQLGSDFVSGPIVSAGNRDVNWVKKYDRLWHMSRLNIEAHIAEFKKNGIVKNVSIDIAEWPTVDSLNGEKTTMAPYFDQNNNGVYDPKNGDYPIIKGDEAIFFVFNDSCSHVVSNSLPLIVQVNGMIWNVNCPQWNNNDTFKALQNTNFVDYEIVNKSLVALDQLHVGFWQDVDLGYYADDFVGCMPKHNVGFVYNGDDYDEGLAGFGVNPPISSLVMVNGPKDNTGAVLPISSFVNYNNNSDPLRGNPTSSKDYYSYLKGNKRNGDRYVYNNDTVRFLYSHGEDPDHSTLNWTEFNSGNQPGDNRFLLSAVSPTLAPGQASKYSIAFSIIEGTWQMDPTSQVKKNTEIIQGAFDKESWGRCASTWVGTKAFDETQQPRIYPVPADNSIVIEMQIQNQKVVYSIIDITGKKATISNLAATGKAQIDISSLSSGVYIVQIKTTEKDFAVKFIKN